MGMFDAPASGSFFGGGDEGPLSRLLRQAFSHGDPEATGAARASQAMEPITGPYLHDVVTGQVAARGLQNTNDMFARAQAGDRDALVEMAGMFGPGAIRAKPAAPSIGQGTATPMFDYSRLGEVPDVPQFNLERYVPPRGVPERTQALAAPENVARVNDVVQRGVGMGGREWYNTDPLRERFVGELGADAGPAAYQQYLDLIAATSPRSKVAENVRNASYYHSLAQQGEPLPHRIMKDNGTWTVAEPLPSPYGHIAQGLHVQNAENVLQNGGWPVLQNPKPASFSQNLAGNQMPVTIDTHNARLWGMTDSKGRPVDMPAKTEYGWLEQLQQQQAGNMGLTPAQYQAAAWLGGGAETGLKSAPDPFLKVLEDRVRHTAKKRGEDPEMTLRRFITGESPLLSIPAGIGLGLGAIPSNSSSGAP